MRILLDGTFVRQRIEYIVDQVLRQHGVGLNEEQPAGKTVLLDADEVAWALHAEMLPAPWRRKLGELSDMEKFFATADSLTG